MFMCIYVTEFVHVWKQFEEKSHFPFPAFVYKLIIFFGKSKFFIFPFFHEVQTKFPAEESAELVVCL